MRIDIHKMLVSVYMKGKLEGFDVSKHEESFKDSIEFLKQNGIKVGPHDLQNIMDKPSSFRLTNRHRDTKTQTEYFHNH